MLAWCFLAILVAGVIVYLGATHTSRNEVLSNWHNNIAGCRRGNPKWKALTNIATTEAAGSEKPVVATRARRFMAEIRALPFTRPNGTTECGKAYPEP